jgi:hypothetical protein
MITPDPAIDAVRDAFINALPEEAPIEAAVEDAPPAELAPEPIMSATSGQEPEPDKVPAKEPEARAYRKLLDGEAKLRAERTAWEAERKSHEAELAAFRAHQGKVKTDPVGFLIASGLSDKEVLEAMQEAHARDLGNLAPPEVRAQLAMKRAERVSLETEARIKADLDAREAARIASEGQAFVAQSQQGISQFVTTGLSDYPQLAAVAAAGKPVAQAMYQTAVEMASANPNGNAPTYADVAKQLNAQLLELAAFVAPKPTETATTPDPTATAKPVLRNSSTQAQPSPAPDAKPRDYNEYKEDLRARVLAQHGIATR